MNDRLDAWTRAREGLDVCGDPRCIPCQLHALDPSRMMGTVVCAATERRIRASAPPLEGAACAHADLARAFVDSGEYLRIAQQLDETDRRALGKLVHGLVSDERKAG